MKTISFNIYEVYYMDNDGQKVIVDNRLSYQGAYKIKFRYATDYNIYCNVVPVHKN